MNYEFTPQMREISGFGGDYEKCCRWMLVAGLHWMDDHPTADPQYSTFQGVFGLVSADNEDARELDKVLMEASDHSCTGAMHHGVVRHLLYIRRYGWQSWKDCMEKA